MASYLFFDRDISWLTFNERVLQQAAKEEVPLLERIKFLSIFSSNLDEFYRVRMPAIQALKKINKAKREQAVYAEVVQLINQQQEMFGQVLSNAIIPALQQRGFHFLNQEETLPMLGTATTQYFFNNVAGLLQPILLKDTIDFFPENNQLYQAVVLRDPKRVLQYYLVNIPSNTLSRFFKISQPDGTYILYLEDVVRQNIHQLFPNASVVGAYNIKITRDAELGLQDEYEEDLAEKMEKQLSKRDMGLATRLLCEPGMPDALLKMLVDVFNLKKASIVQGGKHHNLKDLADLPIKSDHLLYEPWPAVQNIVYENNHERLFDLVQREDRMVHTPYESYDSIVRFFNEAAIDNSVEEIYTTLYRIASSSRIAQALISGAKNGKKVVVLVELKARFDEANNIRWAKRMKAAGVKIIYSVNAIKVHAKVALVKRKHTNAPLLGLLATGNLNEVTARFYTDHILLTAHQPMLVELEQLFSFLSKRKKPDKEDVISFRHLLVAQFNLQTKFIELIDREINNVKNGLPAAITIKMNNLEEEVLIGKLYEASNAGVKIQLIVRSICRLVPGLPGQSENISIKRIVDRYLEHGRVFMFHNNGNEEVFMGSSDWMNRNIYRRIEVCFPIYNQQLKDELRQIIKYQLDDNLQAVRIDRELSNAPVELTGSLVRSQEAIYKYLSVKE
jgi:polyphosphate kinase